MWAAGFSASAVFDIVDSAEQEPRPGLEGRAADGDRYYRTLAVGASLPSWRVTRGNVSRETLAVTQGPGSKIGSAVVYDVFAVGPAWLTPSTETTDLGTVA